MKNTLRFAKKVFAAAIICGTCLNVSASDSLYIMTEDWPPLNFKDKQTNKPAGPAIDIVHTIQEKIGSSEKIDMIPWKRAYITVQKSRIPCYFL